MINVTGACPNETWCHGTPANVTMDHAHQPLHVVFKIFQAMITILIIIFALLGNILVVYAFCNYHRLRANVTNYYIVSLAFSDILTAGLVVPFELDQTIRDGIWTHGRITCQLWTTLYLLVVPGSIINLCAVTLDRFIVLHMPLRYTTIITPRKAIVAIVCLWTYALVTACLPVLGWKDQNYDYILFNACYFPLLQEYVMLINITNFLLPMIFMAVFWSLIFKIAKKHQRRVKKLERSMSMVETTMSLSINGNEAQNGRPSMSEGGKKKTIRKHLKGSKYIAIIVGTFFICWLPYTLLSLGVSICGTKCFRGTPREVHNILLLMGYLNSALNPYMYSFHDRQFKEAFKNILFNIQSHKVWDLLRRGNNE
ncbi:tyramine receptor 1 isoform X2 [Nematostella vectensis]|nr:tyramine receptor 1 isoform X2 [Nematostella vectensis]XP_032242542.1 tyramine receptor 1 isoform X2 [Nematostella vectensis]XP_032242546.1 tyramine receptor 1 isoform X2 [Nematostella vectensis]XP_032242547.1 tyramine receptor 1 isoform X2 [Nematostella vectensis]XP_032242551.1 tyramine receptor 1 isoform X2 [Nematostella vectensis]XP_032242553.1 tyramine receptor 1 isoform X2 [Nematostella vectensis]XP_032242554.1 tyramine receptor 1 isoform X2 [Nematostella vectensis]XP_032242555.1 tyr